MPRARTFLMWFAPLLLAACASAPAPAPTPEPLVRSRVAARDSVTAAAIEQVLAGAHRSLENRARDVDRHPLDTLLFFGIKPDMTVVEVWPGAGGWYTEILAPLLGERGKFYSADVAAAPGNKFVTANRKALADKLAANPELYEKVTVTAFGSGVDEIAPPGSADMVLTFCNIHKWMNLGTAHEAFAAMFRALKPDGILGIVEHRADAATPLDPRALNGYVNEMHAIALIEAAGFELVAQSVINANPRDTRDYSQGVWTLPPSYRLGNRDRAKYEAIGESDRMTIKFRKPKTVPKD